MRSIVLASLAGCRLPVTIKQHAAQSPIEQTSTYARRARVAA
jgi:hypothetical protein